MATSALPKTMRALVLSEGISKIQSIPTPPLRPSYLLVKVHSVALNPTDWKHIAGKRGTGPFSLSGCDYSGTIVQIGSEVKKPFKVGENVYGCAHGCNFSERYDGVFAEYAAVKGDLAMRLPPNVSFEDASTISLGSMTVGQGLFQKDKGFGLEFPSEGNGNGEWVFIYGGSTATGTLGIQFSKAAGYKVVTTASPRNYELVKSRGADEVFDYKEPGAAARIRKLTNNKLKYAWDTHGDDASAKFCAEALSTDAGCYYGTITTSKPPRDDVKYSATFMYTIFGEEFQKMGRTFPASEVDFNFAKKWSAMSEKLLVEGKLVPHPAKIGEGGLEGVVKGLKDLENGRVSGQKLVYNL